MNKNFIFICFATTFCVILSPSEAQQVPTAPAAPSAPATLNRGSKTITSAPLARYFGHSKEQRELDEKIREEAVNLRQAADNGSRERAEAKLVALLGEDYDDRMKSYEDNLDRLEAELEEMRNKLQKRRAAKDDMIRLRIKVLEAEADDLGWPERARGSSSNRLNFSNFNSQTPAWRETGLKTGGK